MSDSSDRTGDSPAGSELRAQLAAELPDGATRGLDDSALDLLRDELTLGDDEQTQAANSALRALARASRAYLIYDARNEIIKTFLGRLKHGFEEYGNRFGAMELEVRPFEMVLGGKTVYLERDRERSLAFKLFRDGVRRLTIQEGVQWEELTQLLQILSIRYIGVRLNEDDILTLLWKAGFAHIDIEAVEGFIEDDEEEVDDGAASGAALSNLQWTDADEAEAAEAHDAAMKAPPNFDLPAPELPDPVPPRRMFLPDGHRESLRDELASHHLSENVLRLNDYLLRAVADPIEYTTWDDARNFLKESRDFLMAEGEVHWLLGYRKLLEHFSTNPELDDDTREAAEAMVAGFTDGKALRRILRSIPIHVRRPPEEYLELLETSQVDSLAMVMDVLDEERSPHLRRIARQLIEQHLPDEADAVVARYRERSGAVAADLLRVLTNGAPDVVQPLFQELVRGSDSDVKVEFLRMAQSDRLEGNLRSLLVVLLSAPEERVRIRALKVIATQKERGAFRPVLARAEEAAKSRAEPMELDAYGKALAHIDPDRALQRFAQWAAPRKGLQRLVATSSAKTLQRVALSGLREMPITAATDAIRNLAQHGAGEEVKELARAELSRRARARRDSETAEEGGLGAAPTDDASTGDTDSGDFDRVTGELSALTSGDFEAARSKVEQLRSDETWDDGWDGVEEEGPRRPAAGDLTGVWLPLGEDLE